MPASQAGRRRFESGLPLHKINDLGTLTVSGVTAITAISSRSPRGAAGGCCYTLQPNTRFPREASITKSPQTRRLPKVSPNEGALKLPDGRQARLEVAHGIFIFVHVNGVAHLCRAGVGVNTGLLRPAGERPPHYLKRSPLQPDRFQSR